MNTREQRELFIKAVTENINANEEEILKRWLVESDENRNEFENFKKIWTESAPNQVAQIPDIDMEWIALNKRIEQEAAGKCAKDSILSKIYSTFQSAFIPKWKPALGFAVAAVLLVSIFIINRKETTSKLLTAVTVNSEHKLIRLSDGTAVLLNNNSSLNYPETFEGKVREVTLSGEAFFSVTKDTRPFIIMTTNAKTTVLGTEFDVWARGVKTRVIVKEGRVNLAAKKENGGVILTKDQQSVVDSSLKPTQPQKVESLYLLGWMENKLVFDKSPLSEVIDELGRFYGVKVSLASENLKTYSLTGSFKNGSADSAITMICLALDLKYEKQNNGYVIRPRTDFR